MEDDAKFCDVLIFCCQTSFSGRLLEMSEGEAGSGQQIDYKYRFGPPTQRESEGLEV